MEFSETVRGKPLLIYQGYEYYQHSVSDCIRVWRCKDRYTFKCNVIMTTVKDSVLRLPSPHTHDPCPQRVEAKKAQLRMKAAMKSPGATPRVVVESVLAKLDKAVVLHLPKLSSLERNLRHYAIEGPTTPTKNLKLGLQEEIDTSEAGEFLQAQEEDFVDTPTFDVEDNIISDSVIDVRCQNTSEVSKQLSLKELAEIFVIVETLKEKIIDCDPNPERSKKACRDIENAISSHRVLYEELRKKIF